MKFLLIAVVLIFAGAGCNNTPLTAGQEKTPDNFITALQASSPAAAKSKILKESDQHAGVLVIYDSSLNSDMAIDLSGNMNYSGIYGNLGQNHTTAQGEVSDYLANTGEYARAVQPVANLTSGTTVYQDSKGTIYSQDGGTRDTDLQQADLEQDDNAARVQAMADHFQMSADAASQLIVLADQVQKLSAQGAMTDEDRQAITEATLNVAGVSSSDISNAINSAVQTGRMDSVNDLMDKAAANLGISTDNLRGKLLPALGVDLGN
jgi:hypothetical protein